MQHNENYNFHSVLSGPSSEPAHINQTQKDEQFTSMGHDNSHLTQGSTSMTSGQQKNRNHLSTNYAIAQQDNILQPLLSQQQQFTSVQQPPSKQQQQYSSTTQRQPFPPALQQQRFTQAAQEKRVSPPTQQKQQDFHLQNISSLVQQQSFHPPQAQAQFPPPERQLPPINQQQFSSQHQRFTPPQQQQFPPPPQQEYTHQQQQFLPSGQHFRFPEDDRFPLTSEQEQSNSSQQQSFPSQYHKRATPTPDQQQFPPAEHQQQFPHEDQTFPPTSSHQQLHTSHHPNSQPRPLSAPQKQLPSSNHIQPQEAIERPTSAHQLDEPPQQNNLLSDSQTSSKLFSGQQTYLQSPQEFQADLTSIAGQKSNIETVQKKTPATQQNTFDVQSVESTLHKNTLRNISAEPTESGDVILPSDSHSNPDLHRHIIKLSAPQASADIPHGNQLAQQNFPEEEKQTPSAPQQTPATFSFAQPPNSEEPALSNIAETADNNGKRGTGRRSPTQTSLQNYPEVQGQNNSPQPSSQVTLNSGARAMKTPKNPYANNVNHSGFHTSNISLLAPMASSSPLTINNQAPEIEERIPENKEYPDNTESITQDLKVMKINPPSEVKIIYCIYFLLLWTFQYVPTFLIFQHFLIFR